jgi:hypothetical protein
MAVRAWHILAGSTAIALGTWGMYDEYFVVLEFIKGSLQPVLALGGLVAILAGLLTHRPKIGQVILGLVLLGLGIYGFYDEYFAVLDFFKGVVPLLLLMAGTVSVVAGVKHLK